MDSPHNVLRQSRDAARRPRVPGPTPLLAILVLVATAQPGLAGEAWTPAAPDPDASSAASVAMSPDETPAASGEPEPKAVTEYLHLPGSVFVPMHSNAGVGYGSWGCTYTTGTEPARNFALELPSGSIVTSLRLYFDDTSAAYDGTLRFMEYDDGNDGNYLVQLSTEGGAGLGSVTADGLSLELDYANYSYTMYWTLVSANAGDSVQLCGFRVAYVQPRIFEDGFELGNTSRWSLTMP